MLEGMFDCLIYGFTYLTLVTVKTELRIVFVYPLRLRSVNYIKILGYIAILLEIIFVLSFDRYIYVNI